MMPRVLSLLLNKFVHTSSFFISWSWILYVLTLCRLLLVWMTMSMYDLLFHIFNPLYLCWTHSIILWIQFFHKTNSISPAFSVPLLEFQFLYINCSRSMPGLCALSWNPSDRYATNVRIWTLFTYLLKILFLLAYASHTYPLQF